MVHLTMDSPTTDICGINRTGIWDLSSINQLAAPAVSSRGKAGGPTGHCDAGTILTDGIEWSILDGILASSHLWNFWTQGSVGVLKDIHAKFRLFFVSMYVPKVCSCGTRFWWRTDRSKDSDVAVVARDYKAQVGKVNAPEACSSGLCTLHAQPTDIADRVLHFCAGSYLFRRNSHRTEIWH